MINDKYLIVCCDGGGIRGVVTALLLQELGPSFLGKVDFFAGTSTGSIIALGLAAGVPIEDLVNLYQDPGVCGEIFSGDGCGSVPHAKRLELEADLINAVGQMRTSLLGSTGDVWDLLGQIITKLMCPSYGNDGRKQVLQSRLPDITLAELKTSALVTTFQLNPKNSRNETVWSAATLHNLPNLPNSDTKDTLIVDAAMCSSSAPLYFPPYQLPSGVLCVDGGVFANNPSTVALSALLGSGLLGPCTLSNVYMLSLGTGYNRSSYPYTGSDVTSAILEAIPYGILGWLWPENENPVPQFPLLEMMFDGSSQINDMQSSLLLPGDNYRRGNVSLRDNHIALDACGSVDVLTRLTNKYINKDPQWQEIVKWVTTNFPS